MCTILGVYIFKKAYSRAHSPQVGHVREAPGTSAGVRIEAAVRIGPVLGGQGPHALGRRCQRPGDVRADPVQPWTLPEGGPHPGRESVPAAKSRPQVPRCQMLCGLKAVGAGSGNAVTAGRRAGPRGTTRRCESDPRPFPRQRGERLPFAAGIGARGAREHTRCRQQLQGFHHRRRVLRGGSGEAAIPPRSERGGGAGVDGVAAVPQAVQGRGGAASKVPLPEEAGPRLPAHLRVEGRRRR